MPELAQQPLEAYARGVADTRQRRRLGITIAVDATQTYVVSAVGVSREARYLIVTAPTNPEGGLITVRQGQSLNCRWLSSRNAFKFDAVIEKVVFEPLSLIYLQVARRVSRRIVRQEPRALVSLPAIVRTPAHISGLLVDLSSSGARLATHRDNRLELQQSVELSFKLKRPEHEHLLTIDCTVQSAPDHRATDHPDIRYYGLRFGELPALEGLMLECLVQSHLLEEADVLSQLLLDSEDILEAAE